MLLAGDIGGTKTNLALFSEADGAHKPYFEKSYPSGEYDGLKAIVRDYLAEVGKEVESACFGVAGPVVDDRVQVTNLPWVVDAANLKSTFGWDAVDLLNDLEAIACAIPILEPDDLFTLSEGEAERGGAIAVVAPGTGLGEAFLVDFGGRYYAHASEGGHASFGPVGAIQIGLLQYLNEQGHHHVSYERVCSGIGIPNIYAYLKASGFAEEPAWMTEAIAASTDPTPVIMNAAQDAEKDTPLARQTLITFVEILGSEAGNLALKVFSTGGIYLGGGIPPRILKALQTETFLEHLRRKGRFRDLLTAMPVHVILNAQAALLGAAAFGLAERA